MAVAISHVPLSDSDVYKMADADTAMIMAYATCQGKVGQSSAGTVERPELDDQACVVRSRQETEDGFPFSEAS